MISQKPRQAGKCQYTTNTNTNTTNTILTMTKTMVQIRLRSMIADVVCGVVCSDNMKGQLQAEIVRNN